MLRSLLSQLYRRTAGLWSGDTAALEARGKSLFRERRFFEAAEAFRQAAHASPRDAGLWNKLGFSLFECGRAAQAIEAFRKALALEPGNALAIQNFLFATNFVRATQAQSLALHREWAARLAPRAPATVAPHANTRDPARRLRIGYLSADLRGHTVAYYLAPILAQHDRERHSIHCYSNARAADALTARLRVHADGWREVAALSDEELAAAIRADGIDILVDLSGHTAGNRIGALALQPAPLQVGYLGYPATLGLPAVGYRITDRYADVPGKAESHYVEELLYLPECAWCFDPLRPSPDPAGPPRPDGAMLFGSLNSVTKLSPETLETWSEILRAAPTARLHLARVPEGRLRDELRSSFTQQGVAGERIEFSGIVTPEEFSALVRRIDVALDPFPCNGGATTCETLWNGTPLVALVGETFASRASYSVLANSGIAELAVASTPEYVQLAVALASDPQRRARLRIAVADGFRCSSIMDAPRFTRTYEALLRDAWSRWCARAAPAMGTADPYGRELEAGRRLLESGASEKAIERLEAALELRHDAAEAHHLLGLALQRLDRHEEAADALAMAVHVAPELAVAHAALALSERKLGRASEAKASIEKAIGLGDRRAEAWNLRGALAIDTGDIDGAVEAFERAVAAEPENSAAHGNLGYVLFRDRADYERGAYHLERSLALDPDGINARCNYTMLLSHRGRLEETISTCDRLLAASPGLHEARLNRALALLKLGRFAAGWDDYEARRLVRSNYVPRNLPIAEWQDEDLAGKTLLAYGEQGLGDEIMFASCFPEIIARAGHCVIECEPRLLAIFRRSFRGATVLAAGTAIGRPIDLATPAGSLPRRYRRSWADFPAHHGYLAADAETAKRWRERLEQTGPGLRVGIAWRGGMKSTRQNLRSMDLAALRPLLQLPDCRFVDLQYGDTRDERAAFAAATGITLHRWQEAIDDIDECAALVSGLDVVVSVCTALVHLGGALARPVWVMTPDTPEWRYLSSGERMPWYPSVRLFRQAQGQGWGPVVAGIASALDTLRNTGSQPSPSA